MGSHLAWWASLTNGLDAEGVRKELTDGGMSLLDIVLDFPVKVSPSLVFHTVSAPTELDHWWTAQSERSPLLRLQR